MRLAIVTASVDPERTRPFWSSWREKARGDMLRVLMLNAPCYSPSTEVDFDLVVRAPKILGPVPAFRLGIAVAALHAEVIACLHDDLRIDKEGWDLDVLKHFETHPQTGLVGFSGAEGLGDPAIYRDPYNPMQLARQGFFSNLEDAEKHGRREAHPRRSACCDGFSLVGRRDFLIPAWEEFTKHGIVHHGYDSWLGAIAHRDGWDCWYLPVACKHAGGMTAVGSAQYTEWAKSKHHDGDQHFWDVSHHAFYHAMRGILPYKVQP